jgi:hypothetical protein
MTKRDYSDLVPVVGNYLVYVIMTWIEKEYANATKETENNDSDINKRIREENSST